MTETSLEQYAEELFGSEDALLRQLRAEAEHSGIPTIQVPPELARLLSLLAAQPQVRSVLEIGALFGYSGIVMARSLPPGARIISLEANPRHVELSRDNFRRAGVADRIEIREGPALEILPSLQDQSFDLVFIDADKPAYPHYLDWALRLTRPGSIIVADNVWRGGSVVAPEQDGDDARAMAEFNRKLALDPRLVSTFIPTRGGSDAASLSVVARS